MHVCMNACMHVCIYAYIHTYVHTCMHAGEASLVFSYGYGEDDDKETDVSSVKVGETIFIPALSEAILGVCMH
jgi:hypothetical protein